jgi:hypothetical protein
VFDPKFCICARDNPINVAQKLTYQKSQRLREGGNRDDSLDRRKSLSEGGTSWVGMAQSCSRGSEASISTQPKHEHLLYELETTDTSSVGLVIR